MKKLFLFIPIAIMWSNCSSQNLVPNPSFEEYENCPTSISQLRQATGWTITINTPDYFNACSGSSSQASVPTNGLGFQYPVSGNAYAGFLAKVNVYGIESREFFGAKLTMDLIEGKRYYVSLNVSPNISSCYISKIGALFTNSFPGDTIVVPAPLMNNIAHVFSNSIIADTSTWTRVAGSFTADSAYRYIIIGNFFDDFHIDSFLLDGHSCVSYYFVDDICVSSDSLACGFNNTVTNSPDTNPERIVVFPNPASNFVMISGLSRVSEFRLYNSLGEVLYNGFGNDKSIDLSHFLSGLYYLQIRNRDLFQMVKVFIK